MYVYAITIMMCIYIYLNIIHHIIFILLWKEEHLNLEYGLPSLWSAAPSKYLDPQHEAPQKASVAMLFWLKSNPSENWCDRIRKVIFMFPGTNICPRIWPAYNNSSVCKSVTTTDAGKAGSFMVVHVQYKRSWLDGPEINKFCFFGFSCISFGDASQTKPLTFNHRCECFS